MKYQAVICENFSESTQVNFHVNIRKHGKMYVMIILITTIIDEFCIVHVIPIPNVKQSRSTF